MNDCNLAAIAGVELECGWYSGGYRWRCAGGGGGNGSSELVDMCWGVMVRLNGR